MGIIRYGVIGVKGIGKYHARLAQLHNQVQLKALVDIDESFVKNTAQSFGVSAYTDYRDLLDADTVDAVSVATPHYLLSEIGEACLSAGIHVFMEKPFAISISEADRMIKMAKERNLKICVCFQYRAHRSSQAMKRIIESGDIGKIQRLLWSWGEFRSQAYYTNKQWHTSWREAGGGLIASHVSHELDLISWMVGRPAQVSAMLSNQLGNTQGEDTACVNVMFEQGASGTLQFSLNQPRAYSIRQLAGTKGIIVVPEVKSLTDDHNDRILLGRYSDELAVLNTELTDGYQQPTIKWDNVKLPWEIKDHPTLRKWMWPKRLWGATGLLKRGPYGRPTLMDSFIRSIIDGGEPMVTGESARATLEFINAVILSAVRKKLVELPLDPEEYDCLLQELIDGKANIPKFG